MMNKEICCGSRVRLSDETRWINGPCNPSDTFGTVTGEDGDGWVGVQWDNGMHNKYLARDEDLIPVDGE